VSVCKKLNLSPLLCASEAGFDEQKSAGSFLICRATMGNGLRLSSWDGVSPLQAEEPLKTSLS
jgi:hypothetical protein